MPRAVFGTQAAGRTLVRIDVTGVQPDLGPEIPRLAFQGKEIRVAQYFDIWRPTGLYQLRRENSEGAVIGWKGFVKLGHGATHGR